MSRIAFSKIAQPGDFRESGEAIVVACAGLPTEMAPSTGPWIAHALRARCSP